jgi:hypothetical protein
MTRTSLLAAAILLASAAPAWADEAEDAFNSLYGNEYNQVTRTPDKGDDVALAADLLKAAKAQDIAPGLLARLCNTACELSARLPAGYDTAMEAMELLAQKAPDQAADSLAKAAAVREKQYHAAKGPDKADAGEVFIESMLAAAGASMASGATADGMALLRKALTAANAIKSDRRGEIQGRLAFATARLRVEKQAEDLKAKLEASPEDAATRKQLVQACLVELDDPAQAQKFLNESSDESLRKYLPAVSKGVAAAPEIACMELGEWYRGLGEAPGASPGGQEAMLKRARAYYQRFLDLHKTEDIARTQAALAVRKTDAALAKLGPARGEGIIGPGRWIDLLKTVSPEKDALDGEWQFKEGTLHVSSPGKYARLTFPCGVEGSYEVVVAFVRTDGVYEMAVALPTGASAVSVLLSASQGNLSGFYSVKNTPLTVSPGTLVNGRDYTLKIKVRVAGDQADLTALLNDKPLLHWQGPQADLSSAYKMRSPKSPGLGVYASAYQFKSVRMRMLSGTARLLR